MTVTEIDSVASGAAAVPILRIRDLYKRFGGLHVLEGVSFEVPRGSITSLIGPNGSGKSTLLNIVTGVLHQDSGEVEFDGERLSTTPAHTRAQHGMARTFQTVRLFAEITAVENVMVGAHPQINTRIGHALLRPRAVTRETREVADRAQRALELAGLPRTRHHVQLGKLSITDQRAVELARALIAEPKLLVLDEPTGGLDPSRLDEWTAVLAGVREQLGVTILLVEHRMRIVMDLSDHVVALHAGGLIAEGTTDEVINHPDVRRIYLGDPDADG
jgi:branched-chain amino acid transport system ATP-binding protein